MKKILMLAFAPIRKSKGQSVGLLVFSLITAMLLNIGLVLFFGISSFYDRRAEVNNAAHFTAVYFSGNESIEQGQSYMKNDPRVAEIEKIHAIGGTGEYELNNVQTYGFLMLTRSDETQQMDAPSFVGEYLPLTGNRIYLPNYLYLNGGFKIGDDFKLLISGVELHFKIAGATEEITFGSQIGSAFRLYISDEKFDEIEKQFPDISLTLLSARLIKEEDTAIFQTDYNKEISPDGLFKIITYEDAKQSRTMIPTITAIIIAAFAIILLAVNLIVIRFRIINGIEEDMANIGVQKAIGYRNIHIITASVMQFGLVALAGSIIGAIMAGVSIPMITKIFEPLIALVWKPGFDINASVISILLVLLTTIFIAIITLRKINKLHPLTALRGGTTTHSFKKNAFPLDKSRGSLNLLLAFKQIYQNKKQTAAISIIVASITMASVVSIAVNYAMNGGRESFARSLFGEVSIADVIFGLKSGDDGEAFKERLIKYSDIRKVLAYQASGVPILIDEIGSIVYVTEDSTLMEGEMLVDGYYPRYDNEIALGASVLRATGKNVGDTVTIRIGDNENDCIITGVIQLMGSSGFTGLLTAEGIREIVPDFVFSEFNVYVNEGVDVKTLTESIQAAEGDIFDTVAITREQTAAALEGMVGMFAAIAAGIIAVTAFVVILILYMIIKTTILRRRRDFGIQKAIGFTTWQLMNQIALNMTPIILLGVAIGAVAGYFGFNPLTSALMSGMGIVQLELPVPLDQVIVVCVALVVLAYAVSMLIAWRIRKISAYALVSE